MPYHHPEHPLIRETFTAFMKAFVYPGVAYSFPVVESNIDMIAWALLQPDTSYFVPVANLSAILRQTGAYPASAENAAYHFYPILREDDLCTLGDANVGTMPYPDDAVTLVIGCTIGQGASVVLAGCGVDQPVAFDVEGIPAAFWHMREAACRFPLGWDVYFVDGDKVIGLPRGVHAEIDA